MKISKKDLVIIDNLIAEKLNKLRFSVLDLESYVAYMSSYDYIEEKSKLENEINKFTKVRDKIIKIMEE